MRGLSSEEVKQREEQGQVNKAVESSTSTVEEIVKENVFTYFNLIFTVLAVLLVMVGSFKDLTFMLIVAANTVIGIIQEIRSKNVLDNLKLSQQAKVPTVRDEELVDIESDRLVLDDVIILRAGAQIPADAEVVEGSIQVNESLITGESDEINKTEGHSLLSGSFVISGECAARLTAVGKDSYISKLQTEATQKKKNDNSSKMVHSLDIMVMIIGIIIIPVGAVLFGQQYFIMNVSFKNAVISMVAAVLGMVPEGLYMTASVAMVVSAMRLANNKVLVQNMRSIETLARVDVLCVDKTGTITESDMRVADMEVIAPGVSSKDMEALIADLAGAQSSDNATMAAMQARFTEMTGRRALRVCPFSSRYKYCGAVFEDGNYVLGAPEFVLGESFDKYADRIELMSQRGYRVLAFAVSEQEPDGSPLRGKVQLLATIFLENPIRKSAKATFKYFSDNGVDVKVISGDNPVTVSNVAINAGIEGADRYIDARELKSQEDVDRAVNKYTVFGRVTPQQKRMFVKGLQKQKKTVGMTGDGVNDILALRDADCSVAMASGSEAASNAAQLVLMDSDFGRMPSVVAEGRRVVNNITKTATLYLTKNIFSMLLALFSMLSVVRYPLKPSQITLISMFAIGIPSFVLSLEPNHKKIKGNFLWNVFKMAAPAGITMFISVAGLLVFSGVMDIKQSSVSTAASGLVALVEFLILIRVAQPPNKLHVGLVCAMLAGFAYAVLFHADLFGISSLSWEAVMLLIVFLIATEAIFRYFYKATEFIGAKFNMGSGKKSGRRYRRRKKA